MFGRRTGKEPVQARSPLHLRLVFSVFGAVVLTIAAAYAFSRSDPSGTVVFLGVVAAVFAVVALVDIGIIWVRIKGADTPRPDPLNRL